MDIAPSLFSGLSSNANILEFIDVAKRNIASKNTTEANDAHAQSSSAKNNSSFTSNMAKYLGIIKNIGLPQAYKIFSEIRHGKEIKTPGKLFLYMSSRSRKQVGNIRAMGVPKNRHATKKNLKKKTAKGGVIIK